MKTLPDEILASCAHSFSGNWVCCVVLKSGKMAYDGRVDERTKDTTCNGRFKVIDGEVYIVESCGRACSFVTETSIKFNRAVQTIKSVVNSLDTIGVKVNG